MLKPRLSLALAQRGASMIEVLVALALVAFTMLGLLGLQLRSMTIQKDSIDRRAAAVIVGGFAERITGNFVAWSERKFDGLALGVGGTAPTSTAACAGACTSAELAQRDWALLQMEVARRLPGGVVFLNSPAGAGTARRVEITVGWVDPQRSEESLSGTSDVDPICARAGVAITDKSYRCYIAALHP
jgi:type IV pilus modification protein PilV